jgi:DNA-binding PadR family transcriptional regulator
MTSRRSAARDGHNRRPADLSAVFGFPAAVLARRRLGTRRRRVREPDPVEPEIAEDDMTRPTGAAAPASTGPAEPEPVSRLPGAPAVRRRFGVVSVRDRQHIHLLLLAAATKGPVTGYELVDLVRARSDGLFVLSLRTVIHELHRLVRNRLMQVTGSEGVRRYSLTPLGERVLATRRREWEAFSQGLDRVLDAADDRGHPALPEDDLQMK